MRGGCFVCLGLRCHKNTENVEIPKTKRKKFSLGRFLYQQIGSRERRKKVVRAKAGSITVGSRSAGDLGSDAEGIVGVSLESTDGICMRCGASASPARAGFIDFETVFNVLYRVAGLWEQISTFEEVEICASFGIEVIYFSR